MNGRIVLLVEYPHPVAANEARWSSGTGETAAVFTIAPTTSTTSGAASTTHGHPVSRTMTVGGATVRVTLVEVVGAAVSGGRVIVVIKGIGAVKASDAGHFHYKAAVSTAVKVTVTR